MDCPFLLQGFFLTQGSNLHNLRTWISLGASLYDLQQSLAPLFLLLWNKFPSLGVLSSPPCRERRPLPCSLGSELQAWRKLYFTRTKKPRRGRGACLFSLFSDNSGNESKLWQETIRCQTATVICIMCNLRCWFISDRQACLMRGGAITHHSSVCPLRNQSHCFSPSIPQRQGPFCATELVSCLYWAHWLMLLAVSCGCLWCRECSAAPMQTKGTKPSLAQLGVWCAFWFFTLFCKIASHL